MKTLIRYFAKKSHNIQVQLLCATLFGMLELYGYRATFLLLMKARKLANKRKPHNAVTRLHKVN